MMDADSQKRRIIDDFGNNETAESLSKLTAPFRRGNHSKNIRVWVLDFCLYKQHGGSLIFDQLF